MDDRFVRLPEVESTVGLKMSKIYDLIRKGGFPKPARVGKCSVWSMTEIQTWMKARLAARGEVSCSPT